MTSIIREHYLSARAKKCLRIGRVHVFDVEIKGIGLGTFGVGLVDRQWDCRINTRTTPWITSRKGEGYMYWSNGELCTQGIPLRSCPFLLYFLPLLFLSFSFSSLSPFPFRFFRFPP